MAIVLQPMFDHAHFISSSITKLVPEPTYESNDTGVDERTLDQIPHPQRVVPLTEIGQSRKERSLH
ncbi:MAG: hypothetical protein E6I97_24205, partial [Chloroflexi bacterium]